MRRPRLGAIALLSTLALLAGACGGDDDGETTAAPAGTEATEATAPATEATEATAPATEATEPPAEETTAPETETSAAAPAGEVSVAMVYDLGGRGDQSFNDSAAAGLDQAVADYGIATEELEPDEGGENREELLRLAAEEGFTLSVAVGFLHTDAVIAASTDFTDTHFGLVDGFIEGLDETSNVRCMGFAEEQGSFLMGVAAALTSQAGVIGFIGGVEIDLIKKFEAGYVAGAQAVNPEIQIEIRYLTQPPDFAGFNDPALGKEAALAIFDTGADVIYHAAGGSGQGLFEATAEVEASEGEDRWAIGVDSDQGAIVAGGESPELADNILTSMLKNVNVAVYDTITDEVNGEWTGGYATYDLSVDGVGYATTGDHLSADAISAMEDFKSQIVDGTIEVPTAPA